MRLASLIAIFISIVLRVGSIPVLEDESDESGLTPPVTVTPSFEQLNQVFTATPGVTENPIKEFENNKPNEQSNTLINIEPMPSLEPVAEQLVNEATPLVENSAANNLQQQKFSNNEQTNPLQIELNLDQFQLAPGQFLQNGVIALEVIPIHVPNQLQEPPLTPIAPPMLRLTKKSSQKPQKNVAPEPIIAAIITKQSQELVSVPIESQPHQEQLVIVEGSLSPITLEFRSRSSPVKVQSVHIPNEKKGEPEITKTKEEPILVIHEVVKPIIQEVREVIQPFRKITQQVLPVQEEVHSVVSRKEVIKPKEPVVDGKPKMMDETVVQAGLFGGTRVLANKFPEISQQSILKSRRKKKRSY